MSKIEPTVNCENLLSILLAQDNRSDLLGLLISNMLHDMASPLNTISLSVDSDGDLDPIIISCIRESSRKAISMLNIFRILNENKTNEISVPFINQALKGISNARIDSYSNAIPLQTGQLIICMLLAIALKINPQNDVLCFIKLINGKHQIFLQFSSKSHICLFEGNESLSARNIMEHISLTMSKELGLKISVEKLQMGFTQISCI